MADVMEQVSDLLARVFSTGQRAIISEAPGGGPEANREGERRVLGMNTPHGLIGSVIPKGTDTGGYGGYGDPVLLDSHPDATIQRELSERIRLVKAARIRDVRPSGRIRMNKYFWLEAHTDQTVGPAMGAYSLFDGTVGAPGAGNSVQTVAITLPANTVSPVILLNRYPGALFVNIFLGSFAFLPTATGMTGMQECSFTDAGGAVAGLGLYNPASASGNSYQNITKLMSSPLTDPGNVQLGTLTINNIGIGGTPVGSRYQLTLGFLACYPDPWFNEQMIVPPTPAEIVEGLRSMEASG